MMGAGENGRIGGLAIGVFDFDFCILCSIRSTIECK